MSYLVLTRRIGETIELFFDPSLSDSEILQIVRSGTVRLRLSQIIGRQARLAIDAPNGIVVMRSEIRRH